MLSEINRFQHYLRRKYPNPSIPIHYINDLELFFGWLNKPVNVVTLRDVDAYIEHCQKLSHRSKDQPHLRTWSMSLRTQSNLALLPPISIFSLIFQKTALSFFITAELA